MGKKYSLQLKLANFFLIFCQLLLVASSVFAILVTYFPNMDPNSSSLVGFWNGTTNELSIIGIISISTIGFGVIVSSWLLIVYKIKGFTLKTNNSPYSLLILLIFFNIFVLIVGLIDKQNLFGGTWFSLLFKESPTVNENLPKIINLSSFSIGSYVYWGVISLSAFIAFMLWIRFLILVFIPEKINVVIVRKNNQI